MSRRVVVIGAGHNGLVAAVRVAEAGCSVLVVEAAAVAGGGVRSAEATLPGFVHDLCSGFFPLTAASPAFRSLALDVSWVNPPVAMAHVFEDGSDVALHRDLGATAASLSACAPGAGSAWRSLVEKLWPVRSSLLSLLLGRLPPVRAGARVVRGLGREVFAIAPMAVASSAALGRSLFGSDRAAGWLAGSGAHADVSPFSVGSGAFSLGLNFLGHLVGWPFPHGGAGVLTDALVERLRAAGGELRCGAPVEAIELVGGRARGVRLAGGERLEADAVICTASPAVLTALLPPGALPGRVERRLRGWRYGLGTVKLDYALSGPVPWLGERAREAGVVHVGGPVGEIAASLEHASAGRFPERPALVVGQQSLHDETRAPAGQHTLYAYARVPQQPGLTNNEMADRVDARIEQFAPGFRELVLARAVRSAFDIERENPSMVGGDLASGSFNADQQLIFRPDPRLCRYGTPLHGLYVAGAWVHPGAGVHGMSGWNAAGVLLACASG
jgi:phytoene dehydrogenase-like protein